MNDKLTNTHDELDELLTQTAQETQPNQQFTAELEHQLRQKYKVKPKVNVFQFTRKQTVSALAWTATLIVFALALSWTIQAIVPVPTSEPAANDTSTPSVITTSTSDTVEAEATPVPNGQGYEWRDTTLYLNAPLPDTPTQANIYLLKDAQPATLEQAQALADQLGIQGQIYLSENPATGGVDYFITDGKQSLSINTNQFFTYTANTARAFNHLGGRTHPNAEATINEFLASHGFDFPHKVVVDEFFGGYTVEPLSSDGFSMRYEFFSSRPLRVILDEEGQVLQVEASLMDYEPIGTQAYDIITAEQAFQKLMDDFSGAGKIESALSSSNTETLEWRRKYSINETITIYGYASSVPALDPSQSAFIQIDGYTVSGNTNGMDALERNTYVEATGQFIDENGIEKFSVDSWQVSPNVQDGVIGTLTSENGQITIQTDQGERLIIEPEIPADVPLPFENAFIVGTRKGDVYDWTLIDNRFAIGGGGGGGGGGTGFYKLNLSGTPVPFPPAAPAPGLGDGTYIVQAGDTLTSIAGTYGISLDQLVQANGLSIDSIIYVDQQLIIPDAKTSQNEAGQKVEGLRGIINITIYNQADGTQHTEYILSHISNENSYTFMMLLEGSNLQGLQAYQHLPIEIWGMIEDYDKRYDMPIVKVERFEIPYPDLKFQILHGTQQTGEVDGQPVLLFITDDGTTYVQSTPGSQPEIFLLGNIGDPVILEALSVPDETIGGYPTLQVFSSALANSPKNDEPVELTITADQIYTYEISSPFSDTYAPPMLVIEKVELMYYVTNPHWQVDDISDSPRYIQPVWRFYGHYENGGEFEVIVQALKEEYLLPELETYIQGG